VFFVAATLNCERGSVIRWTAPVLMAKRRRITCKDCYFRQAALCALGDGPCPTFRSAKDARLEPPDQARLVARNGLRAHAAA
jgi:hypothetical protein